MKSGVIETSPGMALKTAPGVAQEAGLEATIGMALGGETLKTTVTGMEAQ